LQADLLVNNEDNFIYKVLVLGENKYIVNKILNVLNSDLVKHRLEVYSTYSYKEYSIIKDQISFDCIICDYKLEAKDCNILNGIDFLIQYKEIECVKILISNNLNFNELKQAINDAGIYKNLNYSFEDSSIRLAVEHSIEYLELIKENSTLLKNAELKKKQLLELKEILEKKEEKKIKTIEESGQIIKDYKVEVEIMNKFLTSLQKVEDLKSVEKILLDVLFLNMNIDFVKLFIEDFSDAVYKDSDTKLNIPLVCSGYKLGVLSVGKTNDLFTDNEKIFLLKLADLVAMTAEKIIRFSVLERMKKQWEATFDSISEPLIIINSDYIISRANLSFEKLIGISVKNIIGKKCYSLVNPYSDKPCLGCKVREVFLSCTPHGSEVHLRNLNKWFTTWTYPIYYNNKVDRIVQFYKDETEKKMYREKIIHTEKLAEIGILAGSVAHEINNPIGGILAFLQLMDRDETINEAVKKDLKEMENATQRCKRIVENLLHFSRRTRDEKNQEIEFSSIMNVLLPLVQIQIRHDNIDINYTDNSNNALIEGVFNELVQAFLNILNSCIDAIYLKISGSIDKKSVKGLIIINTEVKDNNIIITLLDNGFKLDCNEFKKAFDLDFNLTEDVGEFKTLGMFVSYKIIKDYKGSIFVENTSDGNKYIICFPKI